MSEQEDKLVIFILASTKFDAENNSTTYSIAKQLALKHLIFFIEYPTTWSDLKKMKGAKGYEERKSYFEKKSDGIIKTDDPNFNIVITPPLLSINFIPEGFIYRMLLRYNEQKIRNRINGIIAKYQVKKYIYINSWNFHYPRIARLLSPALTIYHCVDPLLQPYDIKHGLISEKQLITESDLVICTSKQLYDEKITINPNTYLVPNAAELSHSNKALLPGLKIHRKIASIPKPIAGYLGNIEQRIDYPMLIAVAQTNPDISFVLAGPVVEKDVPQQIYEVPNIHFTGKILFEDTPSVIKGFDVGLIPFRKYELSATIFPLKLFEYMGAGKPVVSTDFNMNLKEYTGDAVAYCSDAASFTKALRDALQDTDEKKEIRLKIAAQNTWENRAEAFLTLIKKHLALKQAV